MTARDAKTPHFDRIEDLPLTCASGLPETYVEMVYRALCRLPRGSRGTPPEVALALPSHVAVPEGETRLSAALRALLWIEAEGRAVKTDTGWKAIPVDTIETADALLRTHTVLELVAILRKRAEAQAEARAEQR